MIIPNQVKLKQITRIDRFCGGILVLKCDWSMKIVRKVANQIQLKILIICENAQMMGRGDRMGAHFFVHPSTLDVIPHSEDKKKAGFKWWNSKDVMRSSMSMFCRWLVMTHSGAIPWAVQLLRYHSYSYAKIFILFWEKLIYIYIHIIYIIL